MAWHPAPPSPAVHAIQQHLGGKQNLVAMPSSVRMPAVPPSSAPSQPTRDIQSHPSLSNHPFTMTVMACHASQCPSSAMPHLARLTSGAVHAASCAAPRRSLTRGHPLACLCATTPPCVQMPTVRFCIVFFSIYILHVRISHERALVLALVQMPAATSMSLSLPFVCLSISGLPATSYRWALLARTVHRALTTSSQCRGRRMRTTRMQGCFMGGFAWKGAWPSRRPARTSCSAPSCQA